MVKFDYMPQCHFNFFILSLSAAVEMSSRQWRILSASLTREEFNNEMAFLFWYLEAKLKQNKCIKIQVQIWPHAPNSFQMSF